MLPAERRVGGEAAALGTTALQDAGGLAAAPPPLLIALQFDRTQQGGRLLMVIEHAASLFALAFGQTVDLGQPSLEFVVSHGVYPLRRN